MTAATAEKTIELEVKNTRVNTLEMMREQATKEALQGKLLQLIEDFKWKENEIERLQTLVYGKSFPIRISYGVAQYGIEAAMPKGSSGLSAVEEAAAEKDEKRRVNKIKTYQHDQQMVERIALIPGVVDIPLRATVIDCMICGMDMAAIGRHLNKDRKVISAIRDKIIEVAAQDEMLETYLIYGVIDEFE